jgi:predicted dehydrogenase
MSSSSSSRPARLHRIGVLGLGMGANVLTLNRDPSSRGRVRSICARDPAKLERFQAEYGVEQSFTDYRRMLEDKDLDIVAVYTPDALHAEHCVQALAAGKHVVCTKPMATGNSEAARIVQAVRKSGRKFMVAQTARFVSPCEQARAFLDRGDIGRVLACRSQYVHDISPYLPITPWRLQMPQDFLYGGGLHPIDLLRWYVGEVVEVYAYGQKSGRTPEYRLEDNFLLLLKFASGCLGTVAVLCGVVHPPLPIIQLELFGDAGSLMATYSEGQPNVLRLVNGRIPEHPVQEIRYAPETGVTYQHGAAERRIFEQFFDCLEQNRRPDPDEIQGARGVAVADAAWESIRTGKPVHPAPIAV